VPTIPLGAGTEAAAAANLDVLAAYQLRYVLAFVEDTLLIVSSWQHP
jgi:hypothetical protein